MMTFSEARNTFETARNKSTGKPLERNTRLIAEKNDKGEILAFGIKLHNTVVVTILQNGHYRLNSGGWQTPTTKDRINHYGPRCITQDKGIWYLYHRPTQTTVGVFSDDIVVDSTGLPPGLDPANPPDFKAIEREKKVLDRKVKTYIKRFAEYLGKQSALPMPSNGDCWGCCMKASPDATDGVMGYDHLLEHVRDGYFVPSLLFNAVQERRGRERIGYVLGGLDQSLKSGNANSTRHYLDMVTDDLRAYFRKRKHHFLNSGA